MNRDRRYVGDGHNYGVGHTAAGSKEENDNYTGLLRFKI